jgi:hypothetical protein
MAPLLFVIVHNSGQVLGYLKLSLDEGPIDDELCSFIRKLACAPGFNLPAHGFEVVLHAVDADVRAVLHQPPFTQQAKRCYLVLVVCTSNSTEGTTIRSSTACGFAENFRNSILCCRASALTA